MLKVGQIEEVEITGYSSEGEGICRVDGCAVFVPNAIRGEVCTVKLTHVSRNSAHAKIEQIIKRSPHRIARICPEAKLCGGCQLHHMDYAEELQFKAQKVTDALNRIGGQALERVPITGSMASPDAETNGWTAGYRNKAQYPVAEQNGKPVAGFYKSRTHNVISVRRCAILPELFDRVRDVVISWAEEDRVPAYVETTGKGLLRHIYVRKGAVTGQVMVCLVVNGTSLPREARLVNALRREIPGLASVILSVNPKKTNVVLGDRFRTLWGSGEIEDELCGFTFRLSPRSFYQVNHDQAERLYAKAVKLADLHGTETVLDLYCGTGTITLALSRHAGRAIGVEVVPEAIEDAKQNAVRNGVKNVEFFCADAAEAAARFARQIPKGELNEEKDRKDGFLAPLGMTEERDGFLAPFGMTEERDGFLAPLGMTGERDGFLAPLGMTGERDGFFAPLGMTEERDGFLAPLGMTEERDGFLAPLGMTGGVDVIVVDPPRKGLAPEVIDAMVMMSPARIVYVSCDPATLARDVKLLSQRGYSLTHAEAFDLFPRTFHVETVVLMSKVGVEYA